MTSSIRTSGRCSSVSWLDARKALDVARRRATNRKTKKTRKLNVWGAVSTVGGEKRDETCLESQPSDDNVTGLVWRDSRLLARCRRGLGRAN
jgi:hypothetical protein